MDINFVWIFNGSKGRFPGGVFQSLEKAQEWIKQNRLTGVLTKYPLDEGSFDWAQRQGFVNDKLNARADSDFIASFSSASFTHFHYENGALE